MVVAMAPVFGHAANLMQAGENVAIQDFGAERPVEAVSLPACWLGNWSSVNMLASLAKRQLSPTTGPI